MARSFLTLSPLSLLAVCFGFVVSACSAVDEPDSEQTDTSEEALKTQSGKKLFEQATFGGNGRTCATCHSSDTGTVSPEDAQARFAEEGLDDPLFRSIDSDDGEGDSYTRLLEHATVLIPIPLTSNMRLVADPSATSITVARGIPTTLNTPALDPVLMYDGRAPNLEEQALGAVHTHTENTIEPTAKELEKIADFQQTDKFFSSVALRDFANGGPAPELPAGTTESEQRGRTFFLPEGRCGRCHSGAMLNETSSSHPFLPLGSRFESVFAGELALQPQPFQTFEIDTPDGGSFTIDIPELGRMHQTGDLADLAFFKIPSLWGVSETAPYFHDNSAKNLGELVEHYAILFEGPFGEAPLSAEDQEDILNFLQLL